MEPAELATHRTAFLKLADELAAHGQIPEHQHDYFRSHESRLIDTLTFFGLWELHDACVLEIGPFFAYTPFLYRRAGNQVSVLEGTDPVIAPLLKLYAEEGIACHRGNLVRMLAPADGSKGGLPYGDAAFDAVVCFETMEHFNFNPVFFVRELHRILRPEGRAFITIPNLAKLNNRLQLLLGHSIRTPISEYYQFADYHSGEFLGFHWREYILKEVVELFSNGGFRVESATHLNSFIDREGMSLGRRIKRALGQAAIALCPDLAQNCVVLLRKP